MKYARKVLPAIGAKVLQDAGGQGLVEAYCSVFNNVDYAGEIIRPGFFADTIAQSTTQGKTLPKILWSHNMYEQPIGVTREAEEVLPYDARLPAVIQQLGGLRVVGQFNMDTQLGRDTFSNIKMGALDKYSIGYYVLVDSYDRESGIVELLKGEWLEWSPVNFAANDATLTVDAKNGVGGNGTKTEHLYIVRSPAEFVDGSFKRDVHKHETLGLEYTVVTGKLRATGETEAANVRFDADAWDASDAQTLCTDYGRGTFEPATNTNTTGSMEGFKERLADHGARMVAQMSAYLDRVEHVAKLRIAEGKAGRVLSEANRTILAGLLPDLTSVSDRVQKLLDDTSVSTDDAGKAVGAGVVVVRDSAEIRRMLGRMHVLNAELVAATVD